jgi:TldD protein
MTPKRLRQVPAGLMLAALFISCGFAQQVGTPSQTIADPVLRAMRAELERYKAKLKLDPVAAPYYIDYRVMEADALAAEAAYGALRTQNRVRVRFLRVVVRVGDYKQDSYWGQGLGVTNLLPRDDDELALRHELWLATDRAYKVATEALTAKQAQLKQLSVDQPVDDFARADPVQSIAPLARLDDDAGSWLKLIQEATALYKTDPQIETLSSTLDFHVVNRYFVNTEGTMVRSGQATYQVMVAGSTQAADGMQLNRSAAVTVNDRKDLPSPDAFLAHTTEMLKTLKDLRAAPVADEDYRGPVLLSADAASTVAAALIGENILGLKPDLGQPVRTRGAFASSYKSRVIPDFLSVVDDPTLASLDGKPLLGHYEVDDEGVRAQRVPVIEKGQLVNYLLGREPIRDFPASNGHGRAGNPGTSPGPSLGNLVVSAAEAVTPEDLKKKLVELCRQRELPYGYYVETMGAADEPRLLHRVWVKDGHEDLVRGAVFGDLDVRALRNDIVAAGNDRHIENNVQNIPHSVVAPSLLFDELEVKRRDTKNPKLPEYPPPSSSK